MSRKPKPSIARGDKKPEPVDVQVGQMIKAQRMAIGMSLDALGDAIGVTFQQVQKYEKGINRVGSSRLAAIADALKVDPGFFFSDKAKPDSELMGLFATPGAVELLRAFAAIEDSRTRAALTALASAIVGHVS
jgi:transcriptional regulator with XRE-family HTH domain